MSVLSSFEPGENSECDYSDESYFPVLLFSMLYKVIQKFCVWKKPECAIGQYFPVVLFTMLYKVVVTLESVEEILSVTAIEQYFPVVLFIMLYKLETG